jgi:mono/diheme cytochrome c family protein
LHARFDRATRYEARLANLMRVWRFILLACVSGGVVAFISSFVSRAAEDATEQKWNAPASEAAKENPIASIQSSIAAGQKIYTKRCAGCHGTPGRGDGPDAVDLGIHPAKLFEVTGSESDGALFGRSRREKSRCRRSAVAGFPRRIVGTSSITSVLSRKASDDVTCCFSQNRTRLAVVVSVSLSHRLSGPQK